MPQQTQNGPPPGYREVPAPTDQPPPGYKEVPAPFDPNDPLRGAAQATSIGPNNPAAGTRFEGVADLGERLLRMFGAKMPFGSVAAELTGQKGAEKGEEPRLAPEELIPNRANHPILTAGAEFAGGLTSPTNSLLMLGTGGFGELPAVMKGMGLAPKAVAMIPRLMSLGFSWQMLKGAYQQYEPFKEAMDAGDSDAALYHFTHAVLSGAMGATALQHGLSADPRVAAQEQAEESNAQRLSLLNTLPPERQVAILQKAGMIPKGADLEDALPSFARTSGGKLQIGADIGRLTEILGSSMYSNRGAPVVVKELLQNALDAVRPNGGGVRAHINSIDHTFEIKDTGVGMTPDQVFSVFTNIGASGKTNQAGASGGFGLAKIAPFMIPEKMEVETTAVDPASGILKTTKFTSSPEDIVAGNVQPETFNAREGTSTGTKIKTYFPPDSEGKYDEHNFYDAKKFLRSFLGSSNLPTKDIHFTDPSGSLMPEGEPISKELFSLQGPGGLYTFSVGDNTVNKGGNYPSYEVHNNGLYQFETNGFVSGADSVSVPKRLVVDIKPTVPEGSVDYPFTTNREGTTNAVSKFITEAIKKQLVDPKLSEVNELVRKKYNNMPMMTLPNGIDMPIYDSGARLTVDEINTIRNSPAMKDIAQVIHSVAKSLLSSISSLPANVIAPSVNRPMGSTIGRVGLLLADTIGTSSRGGSRTYGVYVPDPSNPIHQASVFINPFGWAALSEESVVGKMRPIPEGQTFTGDNLFYNPDFAASQIYHTIMHEMTHDVVKGHNESFTTAIMNLDSFLGINAKIGSLEDLANAFRDPNKPDAIRPDFDELLQIYRESRRRSENEKDILGGESLAAGREQPPEGSEASPTPNAQERREADIRDDIQLTGGRGLSEANVLANTRATGAGGTPTEGISPDILASKLKELVSIIPEFNKVVGDGEGAGATSGRVGAYPAIGEDEPPPPVISRLVDDDLAASGINVVHRGRDIGIVSRILGSFNETARKLDAEGHPLGSTLRSISGLMSDVVKNIAVNQTDTMKAFINGAQKLVSRDEWSNGVARLMDRRVDERPAGTPDNIWNAYQSARALDESLRLKIIDAKRRELQLNGFTPEQAQEWYPDTWGKAGEHYPHMYPGTWTITRLAEVDERGNPHYEAISHENISWRQESEIAAKKAALAYLQAHPGEQLKVQQDTISTPASGITDRTRLRDLNDKIKEATTTIVDGGAPPEDVLRQLMDQSGAAAYGPRNAAKRQFGPALQRETNLLGWTRDIEDFKDYLMAGERYVQLAPARQILMKARNQIAGLAGMPQVQKISEFPAVNRYFAASQYGNLLARVDSAIEGLEGHPGAWDAGMRYLASGMGFDPDIVNKAFRPVQQVVALTKLGFQPARVLSHGLQTMWAVYPVLGEKATLQGIAHSFDPHYSDLIHDLAVTHSGNMSDIEGLREYAGAYFGHGSTPIDWTKGTMHIVRDLGLMPFTMGIDFTRRVAATGAYIQGLERGLDAEAAKGYARDVMDRTTGMYNATDNSTLLRQLPGPVSQFKGFMLKTMQFMFNLRGAELARFGAAISLMGVVGFPAIRAMSNMVEQATGYNPENDLKRKFPIMSRGIFGLAGVDQPSSVGFADWFASRPGIPLAGIAGPAGSDILNFAKAGMERFKGPSREAEQDLDQAIRQLSPEARRIWDEAIRGTRLPTPGLIDPRTGASILHQLSPLERVEAIAGFTPLRVAEERETHESIRNQLAKAKDQRGYFVDKLAENQLELMRPGLSSDQKAALIKEMVDLQKLAVEYNQARNLAPAVRDRIRGMLQERLERDIRKAPKGQRPFIQGEIQRYQQEQQ